ncbi:MAG: hypothetical protein RR605_00565 [Acinetobacter sp.]
MATPIRPGFNAIFNDKTTFTSEEYYLESQNSPALGLWIGVTGAGPVYVDIKGNDDVWRTYPELTFTATTAQLINLKRGHIRFRFNAAAATTLEVSA